MPTTHLLFLLRDHLFALSADNVQEVARLAALEPVAEVPPHVVGLLNLRGELIPVVDLAVRMGYDPMPLDPRQTIVILRRGARSTGILVDEVRGLEDIPEEDVVEAPEAPAGVVPTEDAVVRRIVRVDARVATLIDLEDVLFHRRPEDLERPGGMLSPRMAELPEPVRRLLQERANRLAQPAKAMEDIEAPPMIRVRIGGEEFAVPAVSALEFVRFDDVTPVPNCPRHIAGHASLRGAILVVVDLREVLGLAEPVPQEKATAMLVRSPRGSPFAILVDEVLDVAQAQAVEGLPESGGGSNYIRGSIRSEGHRIPVLDIERLAAARELVVQEDA